MKNRKNRTKRNLLFIAGAATGIAATMFWNSKKGKRFRMAMAENAQDIQEKLSNSAADLAQKATNKTHQVLEVAEEKLTNLEDRLIDKVNRVDDNDIMNKEMLANKLNEFEKGIKDAKEKLEHALS